MQRSPDVIVVGLGAVGSAALYQLARRGVAALGIDAWDPPHRHGSSHGDSRITRLALGEGAHYVPLAQRSQEIWRELEAAGGRQLLQTVGCLIYGGRASANAAHGAADFLQATVKVARQHRIPHEILDATTLRQRFPQFRFADDDAGCFEPSGGLLHPEGCVATQLALARQLGARTLTDEKVRGWNAATTGVEVVTDSGTHRAARLILVAGAWLPTLVPALAPHLRVCRQVMFWFAPDARQARFGLADMPVFIRLSAVASEMFYGFPALDDDGVKVAAEQFAHATDPDAFDPTVRPNEAAAMHDIVAPHLRITDRCLRAAACKYTVTPDFDFLIDRVPDAPSAWFASACSGHGFKHSAAVGEALAEIVCDGDSRIDLSRFRLDRFGTPMRG